MAFAAVLIGAGAYVSALGLEGTIDRVFGLPKSRIDVHERLTTFLTSEQDLKKKVSLFEQPDSNDHKHVPKDPTRHTLPLVSRWLCAVRPMLGVTLRLYVGSGQNAFCDGGVTVNDLDNRGCDGIQSELEQFCLNVVNAPNLKELSLMVTVSSLDKDDRMEGKGAIFVARAVVARIGQLNQSVTLKKEIVVPRDCEDPDEVQPGVVMYKILPPDSANNVSVALDNVEHEGRVCNILVTGETGAGKSTFGNLLAQSDPRHPLFPTKRNSTGSTVIRCVRKLQQGVVYNIYDTPGFEDASGADSVTACDLWNLTREIAYVSCVAHVMAHCEKRRGVIDTNGLNKYLKIIGESARRRLCIIITHEPGESTRRTVQNAVSELIRRTGLPRNEAEARVFTVDLQAARETGTWPGDGATREHEENWQCMTAALQFATEGNEETEHAVNMRMAFEALAADPNGPTAEVTRRRIVEEYYEAWKARTARLGTVYELQVEAGDSNNYSRRRGSGNAEGEVNEDGLMAFVRMGSGTRLAADKKVFTFAMHFSQKEMRDEFLAAHFEIADDVCTWLREKGLAALPVGAEEGQAGFLVAYETFYYRVVHREELQNVKWVKEVIIKNGKKATNNAMWDRFEKLVRQFILVPPLTGDGS